MPSYSKTLMLWQSGNPNRAWNSILRNVVYSRVSRSKSPIIHPYKLKGHILITEDTTKYLGVNLQTTLSWKTHIDRISKKASSMLGFLRRNLQSCSEDTKAKPTSACSAQTWNTACLFGTHTRRIRYANWRCFKEELLGTGQTDIGTPAVYLQCSITLSGSLLNQDVPKFS